MGIRALTILLLALLVATLGGCMTITFAGSTQPQSMGSLTLSVNACSPGSPGSPTCPAASNGLSLYEFLNSANSDIPVTVQLLFAARLPNGVVPPADIVASVVGGGTVTYRPSASYLAELQHFEPAPAGTRWWGWISDEVSYGRLTSQGVGITFPVTLPRPADGGPLPSPLHWRPVVGARINEAGSGRPASRAVDCGLTVADLYAGYSESNTADATIACISSPNQATTRASLDAPLIDFGVVGTTVQAPAGSSVTATFLAKRSGAPDAGTSFALTVTGGPPGGSVKLDRTSVSLGSDAITPVLATVAVPVGTAAGSYPLTLTATAAGKPVRKGVATVIVARAAGGGGPRILSASFTRARFRVATARASLAARKRPTPAGTQLRVKLSGAATLTIAVQRLRGGHRRSRACSLGVHRGPRCTIVQRAGKLARELPAGASTIAFSGRLGHRALAPGSYRLVLRAVGAHGAHSAAKQLPFTIVG